MEILIYILASLFLVLSVLSKSAKFLGWVGEKSVSNELKKLNKTEYKVINNIVLPGTNNKTTQIDQLVVSNYGIFIIETKNYSGWIMGSEHSDVWTQVIYKRREKLRNPIHQNYGHIKCIEQIVGEMNCPIIGIVCFTGRAELKLENIKSHVIYTGDLLGTIRKYQSVHLSNADVEHIYNKIIDARIMGKDTNKNHVQNVKTNVIDKEIQVANNICPRCGKALVERHGKFGRFKGCTNYPKCKFTYNLI